jgi:tRNA 2-thiouridine synthesizing protein A
MTVTKLDLSGLKCPLPALNTRRALKLLAPGDLLEVRCTDPLALIDIPHLVGITGDRLEVIERDESHTLFRIQKAVHQNESLTLQRRPAKRGRECSEYALTQEDHTPDPEFS